MRLLAFFASILLVPSVACLRPEPVPYRVSIGMTEAKLKAAVGEPWAVEPTPDGATYRYQIWVNNLRGRPAVLQHWHVHIKEGLVDAFGMDEKEHTVKPS